MLVDEAAAEQPSIAALLAQAEGAGASVAQLRSGVLERISDAATPQGLVASAQRSERSLAELRLDGAVIVLDEVSDPGNLGAVVRVAEAAGLEAVLLAGSSADPFGPKALRASTGSTFRLPVVEAGPVGSLIAELARRGIPSLAASSHGGEDFAALEIPERCAIVLGSEAAGLSDETIAACASAIRIPMAEPVESLNLAVSAGLLAFAASRGLKATRAVRQGSTMTRMDETREP